MVTQEQMMEHFWLYWVAYEYDGMECGLEQFLSLDDLKKRIEGLKTTFRSSFSNYRILEGRTLEEWKATFKYTAAETAEEKARGAFQIPNFQQTVDKCNKGIA